MESMCTCRLSPIGGPPQLSSEPSRRGLEKHVKNSKSLAADCPLILLFMYRGYGQIPGLEDYLKSSFVLTKVFCSFAW